MKSLIIAEKPSVAADLAKALGKIPKKGDHYENDEFVISYALGHLVELEMPEDIDKKKYGFWRLEMLPIIPEKFGLKPIEASKERYNALKKLLARKDIGQVINACDAGREGELIFAYLYQLTKSKLPVKRAWMQTMTTGGIQEAFKNLRDGAKMAGLADAARCRSESDWLIGINGTRALTKRMFGSRAGNVASVGRVQTPTLAIVYARELEIRNFKPRTFWRVTATFEVAKGTYEGNVSLAGSATTWTVIFILVGVALGILIVTRSLRRKRGVPPVLASQEGFLSTTAIFSGTKRRPFGVAFKGGEMTAIFGGFELDLRQVDLEEDQARVDVFILFGGGELKVPQGWSVDVKATAIFGGVEDKSLHLPGDAGTVRPALVVTGMALFGGLVVSN